MALFTRSLWPDRIRRPYLRLAGAVLLAPLLLAAVLTLIAFVVAGSTEPSREATLAVTSQAAVVFFVALPSFTVTFGLAGIALLWAMGWRGALAWLATGAAAGILVAVVHWFVTGGGVVAVQMVVAVVLGLVLFGLIRWIAGVRVN